MLLTIWMIKIAKLLLWFQKYRKSFARNNHQKISKHEARKLYNDLIKPDVDALKHAKGKGKNKRNNILNILSNTESSLFEGVYFHYKDVPKETWYERRIAERAKLRRQRLDEVKKKRKKHKQWFVLLLL